MNSIKVYATSQEPFNVDVPEDATFSMVCSAVRAQLNLQAEQTELRCIVAGKEKLPSEVVGEHVRVVHVTWSTEGGNRDPSSHPHYLDEVVAGHTPAAQTAPAATFLELVDAGTVLMCFFAALLAALWLYICYASMANQASILVLVAITAISSLPVVLSYLPLGSYFHRWQAQVTSRRTRATDISPVGAVSAGQYTFDGGYVPPRPAAPIRARQGVSGTVAAGRE